MDVERYQRFNDAVVAWAEAELTVLEPVALGSTADAVVLRHLEGLHSGWYNPRPFGPIAQPG